MMNLPALLASLPTPSTRPRALLAASVTGLAFWVAGCAGPPEPERSVLVDLAVDAEFAETLVEAREIDLGSPPGRRALDGGWSTRDEADGHGSFVWAVGESSELRLPILEPRPLRLRIELRAFHFEGAPPQSVTVVLGGAELAKSPLGAAVSTVEVALPEARQIIGDNALTLRWAWNRTPQDALGVADRRPLAAAVYGIKLGAGDSNPGTSSADDAHVMADVDRLWIPGGGRIDFYVDLPEQSVLAVDQVQVRGDARPVLELESPDGARELELGAGQLALPAGLTRLRLKVTGGGGAMLHGPTVLAPGAASTDGPDSTTPTTRPGPEAGPEAAPAAVTEDRSIILYSIDTLRADVLELYGGPVPTPALRSFAEDAVIFDAAVSQSSWTKASMASVLTGLAPPVHGALSRRHVLAPERVTLQEMLSAAGYQTAAFSTNPNLTRAFGFDQGFDFFVELPETATADDVLSTVRMWLENERKPERPLFLWVHTLDPHSPYDPPQAARERWAADVDPAVAAESRRYLDDMRALRIPRDEAVLDDLRALYRAEAAYSDLTKATIPNKDDVYLK
ncbi:MAG: sulfatase-like hydrolase/transferase, partial [Acidobacteriota bacterium]